jgi:hypothetical protein
MRSGCRMGCLKFWWRQAEMVWRETVHFFQARSVVNSNQGGASLAGASRQAPLAAAIDSPAMAMAGKCLRPREVSA